jgi:prepilin-type N-terminal cleavage/methylation domain-containing protein
MPDLVHERGHSGEQGFTLVEILPALAVASVIILATAALLHNLAVPFARGTSRVSNGERLVLAAERLATDIGSARFISQAASAGATAAFLGKPGKVTFINGSAEVVSLDVEAAGNATQIVRRRAAWPGQRTQLQSVALGDQVVLLAGGFDASFSFARGAPDGSLTWVNSWVNEPALPRLVKLSLRDHVTGVDLFGGTAFVIHADAPAACARQDAAADCLAGSTDDGARSQRSPSQQP